MRRIASDATIETVDEFLERGGLVKKLKDCYKPAKKTTKGLQTTLKNRAKSKKKKQRTSKEYFYKCQAWKEVRYQALERDKGTCQCCGRTREDGVILHVDHIKPKSKFPDLALELSNLQTLCEDCNIGKGYQYETNWKENQSKKIENLDLYLSKSDAVTFYSSTRWKKIRKQVLKEHDHSCDFCGKTGSRTLAIKVEHKKDRFEFPELAFDKNNLIVVCEKCS